MTMLPVRLPGRPGRGGFHRRPIRLFTYLILDPQLDAEPTPGRLRAMEATVQWFVDQTAGGPQPWTPLFEAVPHARLKHHVLQDLREWDLFSSHRGRCQVREPIVSDLVSTSVRRLVQQATCAREHGALSMATSLRTVSRLADQLRRTGEDADRVHLQRLEAAVAPVLPQVSRAFLTEGKHFALRPDPAFRDLGFPSAWALMLLRLDAHRTIHRKSLLDFAVTGLTDGAVGWGTVLADLGDP